MTKKSNHEASVGLKRKETNSIEGDKLRNSFVTTPQSEKKGFEFYTSAFVKKKPDPPPSSSGDTVRGKAQEKGAQSKSLKTPLIGPSKKRKDTSREKSAFLGAMKLYDLYTRRTSVFMKAMKNSKKTKRSNSISCMRHHLKLHARRPKNARSFSEGRAFNIVKRVEASKPNQQLPSHLREIYIGGSCLVELDNNRYSHLAINLKILELKKKELALWVGQSVGTMSWAYYLEVTCAVGDNRLSYELAVLKTLRKFLPFYKLPQDTLIRLAPHSIHAIAPIEFLLSHFMNSKVKVKGLNGYYFKNFNLISEPLMMVHSLFKVVREENRQLEEKLCKIMHTTTNLAKFSQEERRELEAIPVAYDLLPSELGQSTPPERDYSPMNNLDEAFKHLTLAETALLPSRILTSEVYRLDHSEIQAAKASLLSCKNLVTINPYLGQYVIKTDLSFTLVSLQLLPPPSFSDINKTSRRKGSKRFKEESWIDELEFAVIIYDFTLKKMWRSGPSVKIKEVAASVSTRKVDSFYRAIVYEKPNTWTLSIFWDFIYPKLEISPRGVEFSNPSNPEGQRIVVNRSNLGFLGFQETPILTGKLGLPYSNCPIWLPKSTRRQYIPALHDDYEYKRPGPPMVNPGEGIYMRLSLSGRDLTLKLKLYYNRQTESEEIFISAYDATTHENYKLRVRDKFGLERVKMLMERQIQEKNFCPQYVKVSTNFALDVKKESKGKSLCLNDIYSRSASLVRENSPEHTKYYIFCEFETVYLSNFFMKKIVHFPATNPLIGNFYATCRIYYSFKLPKNEAIFLLILACPTSRFKTYKFIFNSIDIKEYFEEDVFRFVHSQEQIIRLLTKVIALLDTVRTPNFSKLQIPLKSVKRVFSKKYTYNIQNEFDERILFPQADKKPVASSKYIPPYKYFTEKIENKEILTKCIKRYNNQYWVLTIFKNKLLDKIDIIAYVPMSRRRYHCSITLADIEQLSEQFKGTLMQKSNTELELMQDMAQTFTQYEEMIDAAKRNTSLKLDYGAQPRKVKGSKKNYIYVRFWQDLLNESKIIMKNKDMLLKIDTFKGVLKELIWSNLCVGDGLVFEMDVHFEPKNKKDVHSAQRFEPILLSKLNKYSLLLKIVFIEKEVYHTDKLDLAELFDVYKDLLQEKVNDVSKFSSELGVEGKNRKIEKMYLGLLIWLVGIVEISIKDKLRERYEGVLNSEMAYFESEKILSREVIYREKYEKKMKLNSRLDLSVQTDPHYRYFNDILLYKDVFTLNPLQTLVILFNQHKLDVTFVLYDSNTCAQSSTRVPVEQVEVYVPHLLAMIQNKMFTEAGSRIIAAFKNSLLMSSYLNKDKNSVQSN